RGEKRSGQVIRAAVWEYIQRPDVAPDGWQRDLGLPLTQPVPALVPVGGAVHRAQIVAFWHGALLEDDGASGAEGTPSVMPLATGVAYLRTLDAPPVVIAAQQTAWAPGNTAVLSGPGSGTATHIGLNFPLTLSGAAQWAGNDLWLAAHWQSPHTAGDGWADASALVFSAPAPDA